MENNRQQNFKDKEYCNKRRTHCKRQIAVVLEFGALRPVDDTEDCPFKKDQNSFFCMIDEKGISSM